MWGQILLEASIQQNFNFGFSTHKSDILLHLSQWQYWWWFWFSLVWVAYYYIIIFCVTKRVFLFNPVINTSIRGHGKWGDFLVALIPLSWCGNILVNSNFILRMIEWQNESSLFTLRIQGKQWYWVYKFDATTTFNLSAAPKNIGINKWFFWTPTDIYISDSYYQLIHMSAQIEFQDTYKTLLTKASTTKTTLESAQLLSPKILLNNGGVIKSENITSKKLSNLITTTGLELSLFKNIFTSENITTQTYTQPRYLNTFLIFNSENILHKPKTYVNISLLKATHSITHYDFMRIDDNSDTMGNVRQNITNFFFRLLPNPINIELLDNQFDLFQTKYYTKYSAPTQKVYQTETLWGFRQKKYKRLKKFIFTPNYQYDPLTFEILGKKQDNLINTQRNIRNNQIDVLDNKKTPVINNSIKIYKQDMILSKPTALTQSVTLDPAVTNNKLAASVSTSFDYYKAIRNNKHRSDLLSVTLARRLLRVKRTLVLPAHINITIITNSYDVVHSWFIPGLGIKMDCVPGRSTHHTFYIDNVGFYYGQCAEICGRYHHHMPIRICAVTFEQFLVWWYKKGAPRLNRSIQLGQDSNSSLGYFNYQKNKHNTLVNKHNW